MLNDIYPPTIEINTVVNKARLFVGDRWIIIGDLEFEMKGKLLIEIKLPDIDRFIERMDYYDDGRADWAEWGPRIN